MPKFTSPIARELAVWNLDRSVAFYQEVLGFVVSRGEEVAVALRGPVQIQLCPVLDPPPSSIVFLETADLVSAQTELRQRGAVTSEVVEVNWIKQRVFEIRDPDGHALWFGQSYHKEPDSPSRRMGQPPGIRLALPELPFDDVAAAVGHYQQVFGFQINYQQADLAVMYRDAITILLIARTEKHRGIGSFEAYVEDADALYAELQGKGARLDGPPVSQPWGLRLFQAFDLEGNRITFAQTFE
jgi:uncharacterized glyoxalase superfamily protein PhnB